MQAKLLHPESRLLSAKISPTRSSDPAVPLMPYFSRRVLIAAFSLLSAVALLSDTIAQDSPPIQLPELRQELLERRERDQKIRNAMIKSGAESPDPKIGE